MSATTVATEQLWFLNTLVEVRIAHGDGEDGMSVLESYAPYGDSPPLHVHHTEDEIFHVLEGELRVQLGDRELHVAAGETRLLPKGVPHTYCVESREGARTLVLTTNGDFEGLVRDVSRPAERAELPEPSGPPTEEQASALAVACLAHGIELLGPPLAPLG